MPARTHLAVHVQRTHQPNRGKGHPRHLQFNVRRANMVEHMNVTSVGTVLRSRTLDDPSLPKQFGG